VERLATVRPLGADFAIQVPERLVEEYEVVGYERMTSALVGTVARGVDLLVDIGAHVGYFSLLAAHANPELAIVAVEASPDNASVLRSNLEGIGGERVRVVEAAAGEAPGTATFYVPSASDNGGLSPHPASDQHTAVEVKVVDGPSLELPPVESMLIKIDVEGHEVAVLRGLRDVIASTPDIRLLVEVNPACLTAADSSIPALAATLAEFDLRVFVLDESEQSWREAHDAPAMAEILGGRPYANLYAVRRQRGYSASVVMHSGALGGAERSTADLADSMIRQGAMVHAVVPLPDDGLAAELRAAGVSVDLVPPTPWWMPAPRPGVPNDEWRTAPLLAEPLVEALRLADADVVVSKTAVFPHGAVAAAVLGRPHVWMLHEFGDRDHHLALPGPVVEIGRMVSALSVAVTAASQAVRAHFFPPGSEAGVEVLYTAPRLRGKVTAPTDAAPRDWTVGVLAGLHAGKGQEDAIGAVAELRRRGMDVRLALYGSGAADEVLRLRGIAQALGVADLVEIREPLAPAEALGAIDVVAITAHNEAFGRVPFEAAAANVPIVYADAGGLRETMVEGKSGLSYPPGAVEQLADRIAELRLDPEKSGQLVQGARELLLSPDRARTFDADVVRVFSQAARSTPTVGSQLLGASLSATPGDDAHDSWAQISHELRREFEELRQTHLKRIVSHEQDLQELARIKDALAQRVQAHERIETDVAELADALQQRTDAHETLLTEHWELNAVREELATERAALAAENRALADRIAASTTQIEHLAREAERLAVLERSRAFRAVAFGRRLVGRLAPGGTHRRGIYERTLRVAGSLARRTRPRAPQALPAPPPPIRIPVFDAEPVASIVVPIFGKWDYTERCLRSIAATAGELPFEVIVVDDASPDDSLERLRTVEGITIVAMPENVGFTRAANAGIGAARGEHVVMLNNDTEVTPGWLEALVDCAEDPRAGVVGAKLIFPDGRLQEAGGIIFEDGDGWNYGRSEDPTEPQYNFRKRVDYCSGAALLITRRLLDVVGGFDERYAPAYYEDTDLAFEARRHGFEAIYEPHSVVIHHEGVSHGTDESAGIKAHQVLNRAKFIEKWSAELAEQFPHEKATLDSVAVPAVRRGRGTVVIVDHMVPLWREDSGSLRMQRIILNFLDLGYDVVFFPDNRYPMQPYTAELQRLGVLVWYGHGDVLRYLKQIADEIEFVILARQPVAAAHLYNFRVGLPGVPIIFDTVDLHFLREERGAALGLGSAEGAAVTKQLELALMRATDATLVVSDAEAALLARVVPDVDVFVVSNVHDADSSTPLEERREITFVGSFQHPPNADAITWFAREVLPLVQAELGPVPVSIVGRNPPPIIAGDGVTLHGWVEDLEPIHARSRVAIAPLLYGAGVKGKVGDAWAHGVPAVMTSVAAEGMFVEPGVTGFVADDAEGFAAGIVHLFRDDDEWQRMSATVRAHVAQHFGSGRLRTAIESLVVHLAARRADRDGSD